jgi:hypothetical protein
MTIGIVMMDQTSTTVRLPHSLMVHRLTHPLPASSPEIPAMELSDPQMVPPDLVAPDPFNMPILFGKFSAF